MWADIQIFNSLRASDKAQGSTRLITGVKEVCTLSKSPGICAGGRRVCTWPRGRPASPTPFLQLEDTHTLSLKLQNTDNRLPALPCSPGRGALEPATLTSGRGLFSDYPLPLAFPQHVSSTQSRPGGAFPRPGVSTDGVGGYRCRMIRKQCSSIHKPSLPPKERFVLQDGNSSILAESFEQADAREIILLTFNVNLFFRLLSYRKKRL